MRGGRDDAAARGVRQLDVSNATLCNAYTKKVLTNQGHILHSDLPVKTVP